MVTTLAGQPALGNTDGIGAAVRFYSPQGIAVGANGRIVIADTSNDAIRVAGSATLAGQTTVTFTDDPLLAGFTRIKAIHIMELRQAVNQIRSNAGLAAFNFTDSTLTGISAKGVHITEPRAALDQARAALGLSTGGWTGSSITQGVTMIKAVHVQEIRNRMK